MSFQTTSSSTSQVFSSSLSTPAEPVKTRDQLEKEKMQDQIETLIKQHQEMLGMLLGEQEKNNTELSTRGRTIELLQREQGELRTAMDRQVEIVEALELGIRDRDGRIQGLENNTRELEGNMDARNAEIRGLGAVLQEQGIRVGTLEQEVGERDERIQGLEANTAQLRLVAGERDGRIQELEANTAQLEANTAQLQLVLAERDQRIQVQAQQILARNQAIRERDVQIAAQAEQVEARDAQIEVQATQIETQTAQVTTLTGRVEELESERGMSTQRQVCVGVAVAGAVGGAFAIGLLAGGPVGGVAFAAKAGVGVGGAMTAGGGLGAVVLS